MTLSSATPVPGAWRSPAARRVDVEQARDPSSDSGAERGGSRKSSATRR